MIRGAILIASAGVIAPVMFAWAAGPVAISQVRRAFSVREVSLNRGDVIRFSNADEFIHHIYVRAQSFSFNSGEQPPGQNVDVRFPVSGRFEVRCEIHPRMLVTVTVQ